jgi:hypothetical protein
MALRDQLARHEHVSVPRLRDFGLQVGGVISARPLADFRWACGWVPRRKRDSRVSWLAIYREFDDLWLDVLSANAVPLNPRAPLTPSGNPVERAVARWDSVWEVADRCIPKGHTLRTIGQRQSPTLRTFKTRGGNGSVLVWNGTQADALAYHADLLLEHDCVGHERTGKDVQ